MAEDPKDVFRKATEDAGITDAPKHRREWMALTQRQRDAQLLLEDIHNQRVFFYPGAGCDWEPLHRLTHLCDTFIFCDWGIAAKDVTADFRLPGLKSDFVLSLDAETIAHLSDGSRLPDSIRRATQQFLRGHQIEPWGKYARLTRSVGEVERALHFFYFGIEGITTFFNLFTPVSTAPRAVCLRCSCDPNGPYFCEWGGPFAQLVRRCQVKPSYVLGCGGPGSSWPYSRLWQQFPGWLDMGVSPDYVPEGIQCNPLGSARRVIVKRGILTPEAVAGMDAVVLSIPLYKKHREQWPKGTRIILLAPASQRGQLPAQDDRVVFLRSKRAPLGRLLDSLAEACKSFAIDRVSSVGIGYEDEGPVLQEWREQPGEPLELTIYCVEEGDVTSFGPYADQIQ